jgi:hypothetical protein
MPASNASINQTLVDEVILDVLDMLDQTSVAAHNSNCSPKVSASELKKATPQVLIPCEEQGTDTVCDMT